MEYICFHAQYIATYTRKTGERYEYYECGNHFHTKLMD